jgi:nucleoside-diphosphate-sugar epimerase
VWREPLELTRNVKMRLVGGGKGLLPLIYADDIARYVLVLFEQPAPLDRYELHIVSNPQPTTMRDVFNFIADYFGVPRPRSVPALPLSLAARIVQWMPTRTRTGRLKLLTPARVAQFSRGYDLSLVLDQPLLKQIQLTDYRDGLRRMLDDFSGAAAGKA